MNELNRLELLDLLGIAMTNAYMFHTAQRSNVDVDALKQENAGLKDQVEGLSILNELYLDLTRSIFSKDKMVESVKKMIAHARRLVGAEVGISFILDDNQKVIFKFYL